MPARNEHTGANRLADPVQLTAKLAQVVIGHAAMQAGHRPEELHAKSLGQRPVVQVALLLGLSPRPVVRQSGYRQQRYEGCQKLPRLGCQMSVQLHAEDRRPNQEK
jgi:hypothetical protein